MPRERLSRSGARRRLTALLAGCLLLYAFPLWWGLPGSGDRGKTWAFDEIISDNPGKSVRSRHNGRYPRLHYLILEAAYAPVRALEAGGAIELDRERERAWLQAVGRLLSVLMATASVAFVYRVGRSLFDRSSALFGAAVWAFVTPLVLYAKTINLEAPYLFWYALSILFFLKVLQKHRLRDYVAFAAAGTLSFTTKDQAAALYFLPAAVLLGDLSTRLAPTAGHLRRLGRALVDRRPLAALATSVAIFAFVHELPFKWDEFMVHWRVMTGFASEPANAYPATFAGQVALAFLAVKHMGFSMTWPLFGLSIAGLGLALRRPLENRGLLLVALFPISYYLFFIVPIHFHRVRYFLPVCLVLALLAARASSFAWRPTGGRAWPRWVLCAALGWALAQSLALDLTLFKDSRYVVEAWMEEREGSGERVFVLGDATQRVPRSPRRMLRIDKVRGRPIDMLRSADARFLVVNESEFRRPGQKRFLERLLSGELNYELDHRYHREPPLDILRLEGLSTNLAALNPELTVLRRVGPWGLSQAELDEAAARLLEGGGESEWIELLEALTSSKSLVPLEVGWRSRGYGFGRRGVTVGSQVGAIVITGPADADFVPHLTLRCFRKEGSCPVAVDVATSKGRRRVEIDAEEASRLELDTVPADGTELVLLAALPPAGTGGEPMRPVRIRVGGTKIDAGPRVGSEGPHRK